MKELDYYKVEANVACICMRENRESNDTGRIKAINTLASVI